MPCPYKNTKCGKYLTFNEAIPNGVNIDPSPNKVICYNIKTNINTPSFSEMLASGQLKLSSIMETNNTNVKSC